MTFRLPSLLRALTQTLAPLACAALLAGASAADAEDTAICYNCPPEWADWAAQIAAIKQKTGIRVPFDNKNSGQAIAQLIAEQKSPVADVVYLGVSSAFQAKDKGVIAPYKPAHWNDIPANLKDPQGYWFAIHSGTLGFFVNKDALDGKPVPRSWADLLKPEYKGMVGYLDPSSAFVGYAGAVAVNQALGGSLDNFKPALDWFKKLKANAPIVPKQTAYARALSGEIPVLLAYDFDAYRAKYKDNANVEFVIPQEGTIAVPYVMSLVKGAPHDANGRKVLDFVLSDEGQKLWANAYLRPVRTQALGADVASKFLPASDYARAKAVDFGKMAAGQQAFGRQYLQTMQ
ncbi:ABC transporter substrate-binding protein [Burkholderia ubonensis]|uniref:ABC transporter substrate-binding protein n=1 Tax=Burkholderia ubonensis TaxID=101571 RepID=UPI000BA52455|nr:ABC transporter substrate-binding protein [Burkholderia ubonensis]PAK12525.1 ABC transporter substrate-binding protein [Burkholderia ubonensis]RQP87541.1 extracellular solute-binding protein [Burkholderia ubonensis]